MLESISDTTVKISGIYYPGQFLQDHYHSPWATNALGPSTNLLSTSYGEITPLLLPPSRFASGNFHFPPLNSHPRLKPDLLLTPDA